VSGAEHRWPALEPFPLGCCDNGWMLLTVTLTGPQAGVLGHLLHKHPERVQSFELPVGRATVFYSESSDDRTTAALLLEVDPIGMVKRRLKQRDGLSLTDYVTDRPYAASSMLAVALGRVFNTALNGRSDSHPEQAASRLPLELRIPAVPARGKSGAAGDGLVRRLFEPLGWRVQASEVPYGPDGGWGPAPYLDVTLTGTVRLADALSQLYILLPVLDNAKHYWVSPDEVDKLMRRGSGWLEDHPERELIVRRYLMTRRAFVEDATARLNALDDLEPDDTLDPDEQGVADDPVPDHPPQPGEVGEAGEVEDTASRLTRHPRAAAEAAQAQPQHGEGETDDSQTPLKVHRLNTVMGIVHEIGARRVVDLGCGEGYYLRALLEDPTITEVMGVDVSPRILEYAERRLNLDRRSDHQRAKLTLRQSSVTYRDDALAGFDAILLIEVIEHLEPDRIASLENSVFGAARPQHVIMTTPNREYNRIFKMPDGQLRHPDHRFEWTRAEFTAWARQVAATHGYRVEFRTVGEIDAGLGSPTQLALFARDRGSGDSRTSVTDGPRATGTSARPPLWQKVETTPETGSFGMGRR
jgi:SAM-dependent methyltransferase